MAETAKESKQAAAPSKPGGRRRDWWQLPAFIAALFLLTVRFPQEILKGSIDDSWNLALIYAHLKGLHFGTDIAFTYGPLGYLVINRFLIDTAVPRILFGMLTGLMTTVGLGFLVWRMKPAWRVVWVFFFLGLCGTLHWAGDDLFMELALFAWGMLCLLESGRRLKIFLACLVFTAIIAAMIKFTLAVVAGLALGTVACDLLLRRQWRPAVVAIGGFVAGWAVYWVLLGQNLSQVPTFLGNWLKIASGYNQAMSIDEANVAEGCLALAAAGVAVTAAVVASPFAGTERPRLRRALLLAWLAAQLFLAWKYGYVRSDQAHLALFLVFVPIIALSVEVLPAAGTVQKWTARGAALASGAVIMFMMYSNISKDFLWLAVEWTGSNFADNARALLHTDTYTREKTELQSTVIAKLQLPRANQMIGESTVDVFGQFPACAIFNGMNYQPRPVLQSYSAYTPPLMELNERFYLSTNAPKYVLFDLEAIDERFPPVEDALALRALLCNYDMVGNDQLFLILRRARNEEAKMNLLREGDVQWKEKIDLSGYTNANLWLELDVQPSAIGRARQFLYKPPEVQLQVWPSTNTTMCKEFRVPPCMLSAGFLANPLERTTEDIYNLYRSNSFTAATAYALDPGPAGAAPWQPRIHYRLFAIQNRLAGRGN